MKNICEPIIDSWSADRIGIINSECIQLLKELIKTPSFSQEEEDTAKVLSSFFSRHGMEFNRIGNNLWLYNLYYQKDKPTILLNSHHDTVRPNHGYGRDPFEPKVENGRIFGLGSNDAGGSLVSLIGAFRYFYSRNDLPFNLCLAATAEEEISGTGGLAMVLPQVEDISVAIVGEPTMMQMAIAEKGNMTLEFICYGKAEHAARNEGSNAIIMAISGIQNIGSCQFQLDKTFDDVIKLTITEIHAGIQSNVIPDECRFTVDVRITPNYTPEEIMDILREKVSGSIKLIGNPMRASSISEEHPLIHAGKTLGWSTYISPTCSDRGWLKVPSLKLGPGDSSRSHTADEFIFLEEIGQGLNGYIELLERLSQGWGTNCIK
ncbi:MULTISPECIES: M20/M25/M40 family metallo-hydrolase [Sphingobacterium]|uniref:M20/M25/M40 family metallo-hydrolase n=1 Tax=Sphingobacterium TaxID=28453 RepID=UPI000E8E6AA4|nr:MULTISPECIES: M20/M25/M40 family metallo-hydrolase [Sphingobacterium]HAF35249.1 acetylornithine deacetylase [Sphingobacterium sp.]HBI88253.1 acetylornithine deacetylase [Sphingobacterium sp.]